MADHSKMSDEEINKNVARCLGFIEQGSGWVCDPVSGYRWALPDYCNSWADAGPIAEKNLIGLVKAPDGWCSTSDDVHDDGIYFVDPKPCRAICIVFLMMKDAEVS